MVEKKEIAVATVGALVNGIVGALLTGHPLGAIALGAVGALIADAAYRRGKTV